MIRQCFKIAVISASSDSRKSKGPITRPKTTPYWGESRYWVKRDQSQFPKESAPKGEAKRAGAYWLYLRQSKPVKIGWGKLVIPRTSSLIFFTTGFKYLLLLFDFLVNLGTIFVLNFSLAPFHFRATNFFLILSIFLLICAWSNTPHRSFVVGWFNKILAHGIQLFT